MRIWTGSLIGFLTNERWCEYTGRRDHGRRRGGPPLQPVSHQDEGGPEEGVGVPAPAALLTVRRRLAVKESELGLPERFGFRKALLPQPVHLSHEEGGAPVGNRPQRRNDSLGSLALDQHPEALDFLAARVNAAAE